MPRSLHSIARSCHAFRGGKKEEQHRDERAGQRSAYNRTQPFALKKVLGHFLANSSVSSSRWACRQTVA
jgi:hypothetical protein